MKIRSASLTAATVGATAMMAALSLARPSTVTVGTALETTLIRCSLDPAPLAAAGLTSAEVTTLVANVESSDEAQGGDLATADASYASAKVDADTLRRVVRTGQASAQQLTDYQSALSELADAETDRADVLDALVTAGVASLSQAKKDTLATIRGNRGCKVATQFLVVDRSEADWLALKAGLAHERIAAELGDSVDSEVATLLSSARADSDVADAKSNLDSSLATVESAWEDALSE